MNTELKLFFVLFSAHRGREWIASAGYIFAKDRDLVPMLLNRKYEEVIVRSCEEVAITEGTVLYGERWHKL